MLSSGTPSTSYNGNRLPSLDMVANSDKILFIVRIKSFNTDIVSQYYNVAVSITRFGEAYSTFESSINCVTCMSLDICSLVISLSSEVTDNPAVFHRETPVTSLNLREIYLENIGIVKNALSIRGYVVCLMLSKSFVIYRILCGNNAA